MFSLLTRILIISCFIFSLVIPPIEACAQDTTDQTTVSDENPPTVDANVDASGESSDESDSSAASEEDDLTVWVYTAVIPPKQVQDMFGRRIAKAYIAIQVTVVNKSKEFELVIHDASVDYSDFLPEFCVT